MISQKVYLLLVTLCAFAAISYAQETYSFSILNNGTCQPVSLGQCVPCQYSQFYPISYYSVTQVGSEYEAYEYSDAYCKTEYSYEGYFTGLCNNEFYGNCYFFATLQSIETLTLTLSSAVSDISVTYFGENYYAQISPSKVTAQGPDLQGFQIHSDGETFFVEKQLSPTQYSTNIGIFNVGETYVRDPFTFSVTTENTAFPPDLGSEVTTVALEPFYKAKVVGPNAYQTYHRYEGEIDVYVDNEDPSLRGLAVGNPFYYLFNMSLYEPFGSSDYATLVFQLEPSSSPFHTIECYTDVFEDGYTQYTEYECELGSFGSFPLPGSFSLSSFGYFPSFGGSYSYSYSYSSYSNSNSYSYSTSTFDFARTPKKKQNPDNMAFSLF